MGQRAQQVFTQFTADRFGCLLAKAQAAGLNINGNA